MSWKKNDWNKVIDFIYKKTIQELELNNKNEIILATESNLEYYTNDIFSNLILSKNSNIKIFNKPFQNFEYENKKSKLLCSTISKEFYKLLRTFDKKEYYQIDYLPFCNLFQSEILEISKNINYHNYDSYFNEINKCIFIDNYSFFIKDLEWASKEEDNFKIISEEQDPTKKQRWLGYASSQQKIIAALWRVEKETRYKLKLPTLLSLEGIINRL